MKPIPINDDEAERMLLEEYTQVAGKKPTLSVKMVCRMSAFRLVSGEEWRWVKTANKNWTMQLQFGPQNAQPEPRP
jgi:hypothetical protein